MDHTQAQELFSDYWDKTLDAEARGKLEEHLAACAECKKELDAFVQAMGGLSKLGKVPAPGDLQASVPELIERRSKGRFFGKKSLFERIRPEWLSLLMLGLLALAYLFIKLTHPALDVR